MRDELHLVSELTSDTYRNSIGSERRDLATYSDPMSELARAQGFEPRDARTKT